MEHTYKTLSLKIHEMGGHIHNDMPPFINLVKRGDNLVSYTD